MKLRVTIHIGLLSRVCNSSPQRLRWELSPVCAEDFDSLASLRNMDNDRFRSTPHDGKGDNTCNLKFLV